jgi:hypothetical protein
MTSSRTAFDGVSDRYKKAATIAAFLYFNADQSMAERLLAAQVNPFWVVTGCPDDRYAGD